MFNILCIEVKNFIKKYVLIIIVLFLFYSLNLAFEYAYTKDNIKYIFIIGWSGFSEVDHYLIVWLIVNLLLWIELCNSVKKYFSRFYIYMYMKGKKVLNAVSYLIAKAIVFSLIYYMLAFLINYIGLVIFQTVGKGGCDIKEAIEYMYPVKSIVYVYVNMVIMSVTFVLIMIVIFLYTKNFYLSFICTIAVNILGTVWAKTSLGKWIFMVHSNYMVRQEAVSENEYLLIGIAGLIVSIIATYIMFNKKQEEILTAKYDTAK